MQPNEEFQAHVAGSTVAIRLVLTALVKTHPKPDQLLQEIRALMNTQARLNGHLPAQIDVAFNEQLQEFTAHLHSRILG